jgi:hypothetical protein
VGCVSTGKTGCNTHRLVPRVKSPFATWSPTRLLTSISFEIGQVLSCIYLSLTPTLTLNFRLQLHQLCWHISPVGAIKAQVRVQFCLDVEADDRRICLLLRVDVDVVRLEAGAGGVGVALEDEALGLRGIEALVVPAGLCMYHR